MKLYAMGGNSYSVRAQIGAWKISSENLDTLRDVKHGSVFGVGYSGNQTPHLIYRRTTILLKRTYAYTLLLGPSEGTWQAFQWNAAALWRTIFTLPQSQRLFDVDGITRAELEAIEASTISALRPRPAHMAHPSSWASACLGSLWSRPITISPDQLDGLGGSRLPSIEEIDDLTEQLPPCLRIGGGWLIGGDRYLLSALGVRLCVNTYQTSTEDISALTSAIQRGGLIFDFYRRLPSEPTLDFQRSPVHQWQSLPAFFDALNVVQTLESDADGVPGADCPSALEDVVQQYFVDHLAGGRSLGDAKTSWLLKSRWHQSPAQRLDPACVDRLNPDAYNAFVDHIGLMTPSCAMNLALLERFPMSARLATLQARRHLQHNFTLAAFDSLCYYLSGLGVDAQSAMLTELEQAITAGSITLAAAYNNARHSDLHLIAERCLALLRADARRGSSAWFEDALSMDQTEEADSAFAVAPQLDSIARALLAKADRTQIAAWLNGLADTEKAHDALSLKVKAALGDSLPGWAAYRYLLNLCGVAPVQTPAPPLTPDARARLTRDLFVLLSEDRNLFRGKPFPHFAALQQWLELPPQTVARVQQALGPRLNMLALLCGRRK